MWRRIVLVLSVIGMVAGCGGAAETTTSDASGATRTDVQMAIGDHLAKKLSRHGNGA